MNRVYCMSLTISNNNVTLKLQERIKESSPEVQMWQDEWGAQAMPFTQALWLFNLATGVQGTLTSNIITCVFSKRI